MNTEVITIDGPTASGKGTIAQRVASALKFHYLDSGALYRIVALVSLRSGVSSSDGHALAKLAQNLEIQFLGNQILLGKEAEAVEQHIRGEEIGNLASTIAAHHELRQALVKQQQAFRRPPGLVADGRDMGTHIFPDANLKIFLIASAEVRAIRRYQQLLEKGFAVRIEDILRDLEERDLRDTHRSSAPLKPAEGAHILDSSDLTIDQVVARILAWRT